MKGSQHVSAQNDSRTHKVHKDVRPVISDQFREEVCKVYDLLIEAGMEPNEAIRKTRSALKAINYPFATYDIVMAKLRAAGRLRKHLHKKCGEMARE